MLTYDLGIVLSPVDEKDDLGQLELSAIEISKEETVIQVT